MIKKPSKGDFSWKEKEFFVLNEKGYQFK